MKITLARSGGFSGGIETMGPIDTTADVESGMLEALVMASDFWNLPSSYDSGIKDDVERTVTIEDGSTSHSVTWQASGHDAPEAVVELFSASEKVGEDHGLSWVKR